MFYIPTSPPKAKERHQTKADALRLLIAGVRAMAGPDPYYGYLCTYCGKRFVQEGEAKHEEWCIVPLADLLSTL